jgi:hypothetical protein
MRRLLIVLAALSCAACDQLGLTNKSSEAEGNAIGAACRQAGRALEDCYQLNPQAPKASIFAGWKEMNDYMTDQKLEVVRPTLPPNLPKSLRKKSGGDDQSDVAKDDSAPATAAASAPAQSSPATDAPAATDKAATASQPQSEGRRKASGPGHS